MLHALTHCPPEIPDAAPVILVADLDRIAHARLTDAEALVAARRFDSGTMPQL
jgi:hypothetical protein